MPEKGTRSTYSQAPAQVLLCDQGGIISSATGFFFEVEGQRFFVTNRHVVTGRDFLTNEILDKRHARVPQWLEIKIATWMTLESASPRQFAMLPRRIDLYSDSGMFDPVWYEHPDRNACDVVAIPFPRGSDDPVFMHNEVNNISKIKIPVRPGQPAYVIGFPSSLSTGFGLPIWKTAHIASEPHYDVTLGGKLRNVGGLDGGQTIAAFFLDGWTRPGMSGSPVFAAFTGNFSLTDPYEELNPDAPEFWTRPDVALGHTGYMFIGIYSGRVSPAEQDATLGLCWREQIICEICAAKHRPAM